MALAYWQPPGTTASLMACLSILNSPLYCAPAALQTHSVLAISLFCSSVRFFDVFMEVYLNTLNDC